MYDDQYAGVKISGMVRIKQGSESDLMGAVANVGPVSVAIDGYSNAFRVSSTAYIDSSRWGEDSDTLIVSDLFKQTTVNFWGFVCLFDAIKSRVVIHTDFYLAKDKQNDVIKHFPCLLPIPSGSLSGYSTLDDNVFLNQNHYFNTILEN